MTERSIERKEFTFSRIITEESTPARVAIIALETRSQYTEFFLEATGRLGYLDDYKKERNYKLEESTGLQVAFFPQPDQNGRIHAGRSIEFAVPDLGNEVDNRPIIRAVKRLL